MDNDLYRTLIEKTNQPVSIIQLIFNEMGDPVDYITLYMNPAAETELGLKREETIGRRAKEIRPNAEQEWFARYGEVAKTGISAGYEMYSSTFNRYYNDQVIPLGNDKIGILFQDITELRDKEEAEKNAIEAMQESEVKYRSIFETAQEGIWVINGNDQTILVNEKLQQMLGYSLDELVGQSPQAFMVPEFQAAANDRLTEHMEGIKQVIDYRFIKKDGSDLWCILSSTPLFDKNGKFDGSIAMLTDITERKKIEIEKGYYMKIAEEKAAWLQAILDLMPAGVWISDHTWKVVMVNQEAVNMYRGSTPLAGSPEEYTSYKLFLPGTDEPVVFEPYVSKEELTGLVLDYERFDGTRGTQVASTEALRDKDGNIINYLAIGMDITPLRQAEIALKESEKNALNLVEQLKQAKEELINALNLSEQKSAELNAIIEAVPDGLTVYNKKGEMIFFNDAVKGFFRSYDYDELVHDSFKQRFEKIRSTNLDGNIITFEDAGLYRTLNKGETVKDFVAINRSDSGEIVYSSSSSAPIKNKNGEITGAVTIHKDITERVKLEKETDKLVEELRKADRNRNAFLNMLSHVLRNPLAAIMISLDLMDKLIPEGQWNYKALEIAIRQGNQLTNLVDDLLDVTRITQNKIALNKETVELNELINMSVQDYQPQFIDKNVKLEVQLTTPLYIEVDPSV